MYKKNRDLRGRALYKTVDTKRLRRHKHTQGVEGSAACQKLKIIRGVANSVQIRARGVKLYVRWRTSAICRQILPPNVAQA